MREIERKGVKMDVVDEDATAHWEFWDRYVKDWGAPIMQVMDEILPRESVPKTFLDIGAWVGPMTLWAALKHGCNVVAVEPDPTAFVQLRQNVEYNGLEEEVELVRAAASFEDDAIVGLYLHSKFGRSHSSITRQEGEPISVKTVDAAYLVAVHQPDLVKVDIEGGEAIVIPSIGPVMRRLGIPLLLSMHPGMYGDVDEGPMDEELDQWQCRPLGAEHKDAKEWLFTPKEGRLPERSAKDDEDGWDDDDD